MGDRVEHIEARLTTLKFTRYTLKTCTVGCSVNDLDYYYPCQQAELFVEVVFELRGRWFNPQPGQFYPYNNGARNGTVLKKWTASVS